MCGEEMEYIDESKTRYNYFCGNCRHDYTIRKDKEE
jgi:hypothetical protein